MPYALRLTVALLFMLFPLCGARAAEQRLALVIGEADYRAKPLATAANDAGLIAQTLQAAGFDVSGARDLEEDLLRRTLREFFDKVASVGPETVVVIYFNGYGLQYQGENYLVPINADISRESDIPLKAVRITDYLKPLAASAAKLSVVILDAARANPFPSGAMAGGLALYEPGPKMLLAFNAAPGTIAPEEKGPYGAYAHALAEMIREGGRSLPEVFERLRLRVADSTKGAIAPWNSAKLEPSFVFFERSSDAPPLAENTAHFDKPISELGPQDGYTAALRSDTVEGYQDFLALYPGDPQAKRVRAMLALRREALTWRRARDLDRPEAYWSYLRRYPRGAHAVDAQHRLSELASTLEPPPRTDFVNFEAPPPPPEELIYADQQVLALDDPSLGFAPPPRDDYLPPPPPDFVDLVAPILIATAYALPFPEFVPLPIWINPPRYLAQPPNNVVFANIHKRVAIDPVSKNVVVGPVATQTIVAPTVCCNSVGPKAAGLAAAAVGAALPAAVLHRTSTGGSPSGQSLRSHALPAMEAPSRPLGGVTAARAHEKGAGGIDSNSPSTRRPSTGQPLRNHAPFAAETASRSPRGTPATRAREKVSGAIDSSPRPASVAAPVSSGRSSDHRAAEPAPRTATPRPAAPGRPSANSAPIQQPVYRAPAPQPAYRAPAPPRCQYLNGKQICN